MIQLFQSQMQTKNYIAKYNANAKTESQIKIPGTVISVSPCGDVITPHNVEFEAAMEERTWSNV